MLKVPELKSLIRAQRSGAMSEDGDGDHAQHQRENLVQSGFEEDEVSRSSRRKK